MRTLLLGVISAALVLPWVSRADDNPTADEIVKKYIDARGGIEKIKAVQSLKITGKAVIGGGQMEAPMVMETKRPNAMRIDMTVQGKTLVQAFDGATAWMVNPFMGSDDPQKSPEEDTKAMADDADFDGALVDYKDKGNTIELAGKEDVEGSSAYKLKVTKKTGNVEYDYIDAQTWLPVKIAAKRKQMGQEMEVESFPSNYKAVNGVMTPFALDQKVGGKSMMQIVADKVEANVPMDDAMFKIPARKETKEDKK